MQLHFQGGFGEKGRTSVCIQGDGTRVMLDAGIKVGAPDAEYHPDLSLPARDLDALVISHAHEDHVGALCRIAAQGFAGPIYMTSETLSETPATLAQYARPADLAAYPLARMDIRVIDIGARFRIGALAVDTGHSGHVAGGMWIAVTGTRARVVYCGDMVSDSAVFPMTALPSCDILLADASYGADPVPAHERAASVAAWIAAHPGASVLPTPLSGRSLELIAILRGPFAIAADMADPLLAQTDAVAGQNGGLSARLGERILGARLWRQGDDLPAMPLLVHDGMGVAGPAASAIPQALSTRVPMLFTGHLPEGSPGALAVADGRGDWIRLPTHPTLHDNIAFCRTTGASLVFGHSCPPDGLHALAKHIDVLDPGAVTGQTHIVTGRIG